MGNYKVDNYFNEQFGELWKESREQQAYELGFGRGMFELYKYIALDNGEEYSDNLFESIAKSNEHFQKYVELYKERDSESEKLAYKHQKYKEQIKSKMKEENIKLIKSLDRELENFEKRKNEDIEEIKKQIENYKEIIEMKKKSIQDIKYEIQ